MKCIFGHLSHILDLHTEENQFSSYRPSLKLNEFKGLTDPHWSQIFLCHLVSDPQSSAFLEHVTTWPVTISTGSTTQARRQHLRAVQLRADLPQDCCWYTSMGSSDVKCYFQVWFILCSKAEGFVSSWAVADRSSQRFRALSHTHLHYCLVCKKYIYR